jgi:hypothetical protein
MGDDQVPLKFVLTLDDEVKAYIDAKFEELKETVRESVTEDPSRVAKVIDLIATEPNLVVRGSIESGNVQLVINFDGRELAVDMDPDTALQVAAKLMVAADGLAPCECSDEGCK